MKIKYILLLCTIILSCHTHSPRAFKQLIKQFEAEFLRVFPDYATAMGDSQATEILVIPTKLKLQENLIFCQKYLKAFEDFDQLTNHPELMDQRIEKLEILTGMIQRMTGDRSPFNDPSFYNIYPALAWRNSQLHQLPDSTKTKLLHKTLTKVPVYFSHAKENLEDPNIPQTKTAISLQEKTFSFLTTTLAKNIRSLPKTADRKNLEIACESAQIAVKDYSAFCKSILVELKKLERTSDQ